MEIIPVIDVKNGQAVHAKKGLRERYQPLNTRLCPDGDPLTLATALRSLYPFRTIYLADLDALMGAGSNLPLLQNLVAGFPDTEFWVDQGWSELHHLNPALCPWIPVVGSESLTESIPPILSNQPDRMILSLDFSASGLVGPKVLLENDGLWPERVIIMSLARIGGENGPDWERLTYFSTAWPNRQFVAAGGVRHEKDLRKLASLGLAGALVATALHRGAIGASLIEEFMSGLPSTEGHCPGEIGRGSLS
jgi:phosphoribosylformimino-5-aminoimidazole carboxamide ribotide isomerase